jgi:hypothetical protein
VETCFATNKMGIKFTTYNIPYGTIIPIDNSPQLYTDSIVTDTVDWVLLSWDFIPDSSYSNIYIGNFFETDSTDTTAFNCFGYDSYYFIDSVNFICTSESCALNTSDIVSNNSKLFYDYDENIIHLTENLNSAWVLKLYNDNVRIVLTNNGYGSINTNISYLPPGFYVAVLKSGYETVHLKIIRL